ncbi:MAG: hypothetical protein SFV23_25200 [Planctomycetaceae bacterium]|nr:hypothetical protein [Planctomycetaceae bacterium]
MDDSPPIVDALPSSLPRVDARSSGVDDVSARKLADAVVDLIDLDELSYRSVPLKVVGRRRVVYRHVGTLRPMSYEYDEDAE